MAWSSFYSIPLLHFNGFYAINGNDISYERENSGACAPFREKRPAAESRFSAHRLVRPGAVCESRTGIPPLAGFEVSVPDWCGNAGGTAEGLPFVPALWGGGLFCWYKDRSYEIGDRSCGVRRSSPGLSSRFCRFPVRDWKYGPFASGGISPIFYLLTSISKKGV